MSKLKDSVKAEMVQEIAFNQILDVFPILDFLDIMSSLPKLLNPVNWLRMGVFSVKISVKISTIFFQ